MYFISKKCYDWYTRSTLKVLPLETTKSKQWKQQFHEHLSMVMSERAVAMLNLINHPAEYEDTDIVTLNVLIVWGLLAICFWKKMTNNLEPRIWAVPPPLLCVSIQTFQNQIKQKCKKQKILSINLVIHSHLACKKKRKHKNRAHSVKHSLRADL